MAAAADQLPPVMAGALMSIASGSPGWNDMRKLAGSQFYSSTWLAEGDPKGAAGTCLANREHVTRWIDRLIDELETWQEQIEAGDKRRSRRSSRTGQRNHRLGARASAGQLGRTSAGERSADRRRLHAPDDRPRRDGAPPEQAAQIAEANVPFVYIVRCADGSLYTGWTTDLDRRVAQHNAGRGATYTRRTVP